MLGVQWLKKCFEPATREKADGESRLLIYDDHDNHISADFIRHCIANDIVLLLLPPHSSHLLQSLDVDVFSSLKQAMGSLLNRLYRTGIRRVQKAEWFECFIPARTEAVNKSNIEGGWRGAGIYPINPSKVLDKIPKSATQLTIIPSAQAETTNPFENILIEDSSINANTLHSANIALKNLLFIKEPLQSPARKYIPRLTSTAEWLLAENVILKLELKNVKTLLNDRKTRKTGKRLILKGRIVISTNEVLTLFEEAEAATQNKKKKTGRSRGRPRKNVVIEPIVILEEVEDEEEVSEDDSDEEEELEL